MIVSRTYEKWLTLVFLSSDLEFLSFSLKQSLVFILLFVTALTRRVFTIIVRFFPVKFSLPVVELRSDLVVSMEV
jgi:hypothetical protein